jgi:hypothetical protein
MHERVIGGGDAAADPLDSNVCVRRNALTARRSRRGELIGKEEKAGDYATGT